VSVTFVSLQTAWVLGTWGTCPNASCVADLLQTRDGGQTWRSVPPPPTSLASSVASGGVAQVRFANLNDGWLSGGDLWATHDGGAHWTLIPSLPRSTTQLSVMALATDGRQVHVAYFGTNGDVTVRLASSPVTSDRWTLSPISLNLGAGPVPHTFIVLQDGTGWVALWNRVFIDGARLVDGSWTRWSGPCPRLAGWGVMAASTASDLVSAFDDSWGSSANPATLVDHLFASHDGGTSFTQTATVPSNSLDAIASPTPGVIVAGGGGLRRSTDNGRTWTTVATLPPVPDQAIFPTTVADLGFTDPTHGVVVTADGALLLSHDGGRSWNPVTFGAQPSR